MFSSFSSPPFYGSPAPPPTRLYPNHVPLPSLTSRIALLLKSASTAYFDPTNAEAVAATIDLTSATALDEIQRCLQSSPAGLRILGPGRRLPPPPAPPGGHPLGSLGAALSSFHTLHSFTPGSRPPTLYAYTPNHAHILDVYRQNHDVHHALYGLPPTVVGEVILKRVEFDELGLPACLMQAKLKRVGLGELEGGEVDEAEGWLEELRGRREGRGHLLEYDWWEMLGRDLGEVREEVGIIDYEAWRDERG